MAEKKTKKKEVAEESKEVATTSKNEVADMSAYAEDAGAGFENMSADEFSVPFIKLAANLSPEIDKDEPDYIEGLEEGMFFNSATKEIYKDFTFIPVHREHIYLEYIPRDDGGGFVGAHDPASPKILELKKEHGNYGALPTEDGTEIIENFSVYGILIDADGNESRVIIGFTSTKIGVYKDWMAAAMNVQMMVNGKKVPMPLFAHKYKVTSKKQRNKKGKFFNLHIAFEGGAADNARLAPNDPLYLAARKFKELIEEGNAKADHESAADEQEIPF